MRRAWLWVVAAVVVAALIGLWLFLRARGKKPEANRTMADVVDAWSAPRIDAATADVARLKQQLGTEHAAVVAASAAVDGIREELRGKYQALELSPEEMEQRLKGLRI